MNNDKIKNKDLFLVDAGNANPTLLKTAQNENITKLHHWFNLNSGKAENQFVEDDQEDDQHSNHCISTELAA